MSKFQNVQIDQLTEIECRDLQKKIAELTSCLRWYVEEDDVEEKESEE